MTFTKVFLLSLLLPSAALACNPDKQKEGFQGDQNVVRELLNQPLVCSWYKAVNHNVKISMRAIYRCENSPVRVELSFADGRKHEASSVEVLSEGRYWFNVDGLPLPFICTR